MTVSDQGQVVAVIGAKGGVGSTFVTVNLGAELAPVNRVCAVDLDFSMGDVAGMLDMEPASHMADLLNNVSRLDERMLAGSVGVHPSGLHVLAQPMELVENEFLRGEDVLRVLSAQPTPTSTCSSTAVVALTTPPVPPRQSLISSSWSAHRMYRV